LSKKHAEQAFSYILFTNSHPFNEMFNVYLLCGTSLIAVTPLLQFTLLIAKTLNENTNYFRRLESAFR